jgi:Fe-S cluster assembly protein SufD
MQEAPTIITRKRRVEANIAPEFSFTSEMIPVFSEDKFIAAYRKSSWEAYKSIPMPALKDEAWRRTDIHDLQSDNFHLAGSNGYSSQDRIPASLLKPLAGKTHGGQLIQKAKSVKGFLGEELSSKGVIFTDLQSAEKNYPELLVKVIGKAVSSKEGKFAALAGAFARQGMFLYLPKHVKIETPLHSLLWGQGINQAYISHILVYLDEGASATYVHEVASPDSNDGQLLHAGIVEMLIGPGAHLGFVELQSWGQNVWNFTHERAIVDQGGSIDWIFGAIGSRLTKNFSEITLRGQGAEGKMSGFYFTNNHQHLDHDTQQTHLAPNTTSDLLFKGALLDDSRSVWQGMIYVAPEAMKADGYQANRNLILSRNARADSIPGLEILADDVKCTHGATVGKIDPDLIYYLISRGIPQKEAEKLVVEGFFESIMERIPFEGVKNRFHTAIQNKMKSLI